MRRLTMMALTSGVALISIATACNIIAGIDPPELAQVDTGSPSSETGVETSVCTPGTWPSPPTMDDPDAGADRTFVTAIHSVSFGIDPSRPLGYDLDGTCTCPEPDSCKRAAEAGPRCDEPGGRDVALNQEILSIVLSAKGFSEADLNSGFERGRFGALIQVRKWNGTANDVQVEVAMLLSAGWSGRATDAGPSWDGGDSWDLDPVTLVSETSKAPKFVDNAAYVRDGVLVATRLDGARLSLGSGESIAEVVFTEAVVTGRIVPRGDTFAIAEGTIAGRWPTANVLGGLANLTDPFLGGPLCKSGLTYNTLKQKVCNGADIASNKSRDRGALPCDALSLGIRFTADPALLGEIAPKNMADAGPCVGFTDECP